MPTELLLVIAVAALILSLLVPVLRRTMKQGNVPVCLANVKSLTIDGLLNIQENEYWLSKATVANDGWIRPGSCYLHNLREVHLSLQIEALKQGFCFPWTR